jgi:hypothetical protein
LSLLNILVTMAMSMFAIMLPFMIALAWKDNYAAKHRLWT